MPDYAQKRDSNEAEIIEWLELHGYKVRQAFRPAPYDLEVSKPRSPVCLRGEVKGPNGKLTPAQQRALDEEGIVVWRTPDDALRDAKRYL
jgi:hypothetical protein